MAGHSRAQPQHAPPQPILAPGMTRKLKTATVIRFQSFQHPLIMTSKAFNKPPRCPASSPAWLEKSKSTIVTHFEKVGSVAGHSQAQPNHSPLSPPVDQRC